MPRGSLGYEKLLFMCMNYKLAVIIRHFLQLEPSSPIEKKIASRHVQADVPNIHMCNNNVYLCKSHSKTLLKQNRQVFRHHAFS